MTLDIKQETLELENIALKAALTAMSKQLEDVAEQSLRTATILQTECRPEMQKEIDELVRAMENLVRTARTEGQNIRNKLAA